VTRHEILDVIDRWKDAMAQHDRDAHAAVYTEDARVDSPLGGRVTGRPNIAHVAEGFFAACPDATFRFDPPLVDADRAAIVTTISGTQMGSFMGMPASGRHFEFSMVFVQSFRDGMVVTERRIYDFTGLLVQLGVLKARPA